MLLMDIPATLWNLLMQVSKFYSKKVIIDGYKFDSKKESEYYLYLKSELKKGNIYDLELQKEYILQESFKLNKKTRRKITYKADFTFKTTKDDKLHVVDVKGFKTEVYRLKKKLFEKRYEVELEEV